MDSGNNDTLELEEGEWLPPDDHCVLTHSSEGKFPFSSLWNNIFFLFPYD